MQAKSPNFGAIVSTVPKNYSQPVNWCRAVFM